MSTATSIEPSELLLTPVRIVAEYQLYGEGKGGKPLIGKAWAKGLLSEAKKVGLINDFEVTACHQGPFGLQLIQFYVDIVLENSMDRAQAKDLGEDLLMGRVFYDGVEVRWATFLDKDGV